MTTQSVPIEVVSQVLGKDVRFIRQALKEGTLPFGFCTKENKRIAYYISPKKLYEYTGYEWKG